MGNFLLIQFLIEMQLNVNYINCSLLVEWSAQLNLSSWVLNHLQESAKNTSLPSLFDPLTLALYYNSILRRKKKCPLHSIHLLTACFLKNKQKKLTLASLIFLYSIYLFSLFIIQLTNSKKRPPTLACSIMFSFYLLYNNNNKNLATCAVKLTETCYSTCVSLLFCWFWLLLLSSFLKG